MPTILSSSPFYKYEFLGTPFRILLNIRHVVVHLTTNNGNVG